MMIFVQSMESGYKRRELRVGSTVLSAAELCMES
jgi:hypothetical protein